MKLGIRAKFIGILMVAAILPLGIGISAIWVLGRHYYRRQQGALFQAGAQHLALSLNQTVENQIEELHDWVTLSSLPNAVRKIDDALPELSSEEFSNRIAQIEARWPQLTERDPELQAVLTNSIAADLKSFASVCPSFAELLVTDNRGQLVAATEKTSDYWQADESWWLTAVGLSPKHVYIQGISFDQSAGVYSIDVSIPLRDPANPESPPVGVIKGVLSATPLFSSVQQIPAQENVQRQLVLSDGRILVELLGKARTEGQLQQRLPSDVMTRLRENKPGWMIARFDDGPAHIIGYAPVEFDRVLKDQIVPLGPVPLYIIVHDDLNVVLAPVRRQLWMLAITGASILLACTLVGLYIATRKIIRPIQLLRSAAQAVADSTKLAPVIDGPLEVSPASPLHAHLLQRIARIRTHDEIEELARDFSSMARRVLRYHEALEEEIAAKTAEIQRDLQFAREFQESLLPHQYPQVPAAGTDDEFRLNFHHVYKPTNTVGGDFFDVLKLSDHRAGIFIADVMGHGARSALVTAMLRTLLQDFSHQANDPARFLALINRRFHDLIQHGKQFVFVSAFYLVIDTQQGIATYASAGHPTPLLAERSRKRVSPLIHRLENNPALGLFQDSTYTSFTNLLKQDDVFVLFTDGLFEATNADGEQFGKERLQQAIEQNMKRDLGEFDMAVINAVSDFTNSTAAADDICIVSVEIAAAATAPPLRSSAEPVGLA